MLNISIPAGISDAKVYHSLDGNDWTLATIFGTYIGEDYDDNILEPGDTSVMFAALAENTTYKVKIVGNDSDGQQVETPIVEFTTSDNPWN